MNSAHLDPLSVTVFLALVSLLPLVLITTTSFLKIVIVLMITRPQGLLGTRELSLRALIGRRKPVREMV